MSEPETNILSNEMETSQTLSILLLGTEESRLIEIADVLRPLSDRVTLQPVLRATEESRVAESFRLIVVGDVEKETIEQLGEIVSRSDKSVLTLACLPHKDVPENLGALLTKVDDILLHPEELALRLPFLEQRLIYREKSELLNRAILETIVDGIVTIDGDGIITSFNPAAEKIFGYTASETVGKSVSILMPDPYAEDHQKHLKQYQHTGIARIIGIGREVVGVRKNGEHFPMDLAVSEVTTDGQILYTGVVRDITERRQLEHEILRISEAERRSIGQDLHDGLGQMLTGIGLIAQSLVARLEEEGSDYVDDMFEVTDLIKEADRNARNLARGLVPVEIDENGLGNSLQMLVENVEQLFGINCSFQRKGTFHLQDTSAITNLYRIAQESVSNAIKHGRAENVEVLLLSNSNMYQLIVKDDGIGFPETLPEDRGMGVPIMKYRARVIGATLEIKAGLRGGTTVTCILSS